ncbi:hypothetical protein [Streptomyces odontomachi]|uniref:hypothetical protein n=1 Tax=Streptomyces odontomachi TaxID=2944940 RepID=UPI00210980C2|nr:hypothetical protein [Streptomyces sp. ODS25]
MNNSTPEDGEPSSFVEKAKNLCGRHKGKILAASTVLGGVALTVVTVVTRQAMEQNATEDTGPIADPAAVNERRKAPVKHPVVGHTRTLADGRVIPVAGYDRGGSADDNDEDGDSGVAAA